MSLQSFDGAFVQYVWCADVAEGQRVLGMAADNLVFREAELLVSGSTWRRWRTGRATVFDDSFEHEVRNPGEYPRAVMIIHIVHPQLMARGSNGHALAANMNHYCEGLG